MARRPRLDRELERYLVDGETVIVHVRLHWFHLSREILLVVAATLFAFWVDVKVPAGSGGKYVHDLSLILFWAARAVARLDGAQLAARVVRRHRQALPALLRLHPPQGRDDAAAQGHRHDLRPLAARPGARLRHVRPGVGGAGPGAVRHRPRAGCRHPLPRDLHPALRAGLADPLPARRSAPGRAARDDDDGPDGGDGGGGPAAPGCRRAGARERAPASRAAPTRATCPARSARPSRGTAARTCAAPRTWATPARSRSCACPATTRTRRSTRRRTGPSAAEAAAQPRGAGRPQTLGRPASRTAARRSARTPRSD